MEEFIIKSWSSSSSPHLGLILLGKPELSWFAFITPLPYPLSQNIFQVHQVLSTATTKYSKSLVQATFKIFIYLFIYLLTYFWLWCVFVAAWAFSSCSKRGPLSGCGGGFSLWWLLLWDTGSWPRGFSSCGSQALEHRLNSCGTQASCSATCGILPDQGSNHVSCIGRWILYHYATREAPGYLFSHLNDCKWDKS